ncbi:MAG: hypothetical protein M1438_11370 [Deltaproteobacteria bacterium]|nr:hypothetical protein [Deltaproteobacteria bacterium]
MISESIEYRGEWFFPLKRDVGFSGTLKLQKENRVLEIECPLDELFKIFFPNKKNVSISELSRIKIDLILGNTFNGEITLFNCIGSIKNLTPTSLMVFYPEVVFLGVHFYETDNIFFKKAKITYNNIDEWTNIHGFKINGITNNEVNVAYRPPSPINLFENNKVKIYIDFFRNGPTLSRIQKEILIKQETVLIIEAINKITFSELIEIILNLRNFFVFAMLGPTNIVKIDAESDSKTFKFDEQEDRLFYSNISIIFRNDYLKNTVTLDHNDMLFTIHETGFNITTYVSNWLSNNSIINPIFNLFCRAIYFYDLYLPEQLRLLVIALDSSYKRMNDKSRIKYDAIIKNVLRNYPNLFLKDFLENQTVEEFSSKGAKLRNKLLHADIDIETIFLQSEIIYFRNKFATLIIMILMEYIGFTYEEIYQLLKRRRIFK